MCRAVKPRDVGWVSFFQAVILGFAIGGCGGENVSDRGRLVIETTPEQGAEVTVGNTRYGVTPGVITGLPAGRVYVQLRKPGYKQKLVILEMPEEGEHREVVPLSLLVGYLSVDSDPPGAKVYLDDTEYLGETPFNERPIPIGEHTYTLRKDDYVAAEHTITVEEDYRYSPLHELEPMPAEVRVLSRPTGADIRINDELQVEKTPAVFKLSPGNYFVSAHTKGFIVKEEPLVLGPNESKTVELELKKGEVPPGMILVQAGEFIFGVDGGAPDERPRRTVKLDAFYIDKFEVTNEEFKKVFTAHKFEVGQELFPVTGVSWKEAAEYAAAVGKRLPTEMEWEKAARGTDGREWPWGNTFNAEYCNSSEGRSRTPKKVGSYRDAASPFGVLDMAGNVYEWTSDWYQAYPGNTDVTKEYGQVYRVLRGGSYLTSAYEVRCARRHYDKMDAAREDYGFRCAKDVTSDERQAK